METEKKDWTYIGVFTATLVIILIVVFYMIYINKFIPIPECVVYKTFGIYCPGCGATRAVYSLYNGEILKSIYYNPIILYLVVIDLWYLITEGIAKILKKENKFFVKNIKIYLYLALIILIINWGIKLIMIFKGNTL